MSGLFLFDWHDGPLPSPDPIFPTQGGTMRFSKSVFLCVALSVAWLLLPFVGQFTADANDSSFQCPNGPVAADLTGTDAGASGPGGRATFRDQGNNRLNVNVRSTNVAANTSLDVYVGDTKVGSINVGRGGSGQVRVDSPTVTIDEGTMISVRNGTTTIVSGTFKCVAGGPKTSPTVSPTVSPTTSPTASPTVMPTVSPTTSPTASPTMHP